MRMLQGSEEGNRPACSVWKMPLTPGAKPAASSRLMRGLRVLLTEPDEE
jgi:hypothetical protein